ncbi:hypothetical protein [Elongatibacter sediminis]|uniref:Uncharacterized protein n=1 Tax=Elongatibacter sediminis TaxID=3119006 RepID=A0AAW9RF14_9GAMM
MPPARKKTPGKTGKSTAVGDDGRLRPSRVARNGSGSGRGAVAQGGARKRGWRDIEEIRERMRLKSLLADIWHEDVELEEDIFGESGYLAGYYAEGEVEEPPADPDDNVEYEDFDDNDD